LEKLEHAILQLESSPHMGSIPRYGILKKQGYRVLIIKRQVYAVVDGRRGYENLVILYSIRMTKNSVRGASEKCTPPRTC
jgi:hypothetical protein